MKSMQGDSGHARVEMVADVYSHILDEERRKNAQDFDERFYQNKSRSQEESEKAITEKDEEQTSGDIPLDIEALRRLLEKPELAALLKKLTEKL